MCYNQNMIITENGRQFIKCGKCPECRQARTNMWVVRCTKELENYQQACFITLTYADNIKYHLDYTDFQKFMKRLRKSITPKEIKYFASAEYGKRTLRPHFHAIIFGHDFEDKRPLGKSGRQNEMWTSEKLRKIWNWGIHSIQPVTTETIAYCTLYANKTIKQLPDWLENYPEKNLMSKGIGTSKILEKIDTYLKTDEIYIKGKKHPIPQIALKKHFDIKTKKDFETENEWKMYKLFDPWYKEYKHILNKRMRLITNDKIILAKEGFLNKNAYEQQDIRKNRSMRIKMINNKNL